MHKRTAALQWGWEQVCTVYVSISHISLAAMPPSEPLSQWMPGISFHLRAEGRALVAYTHTQSHTHWGAWGRASNWATSQGSWTNYIVRINVALAMHGLWYLTAGAKKKNPPFLPSFAFTPLQFAWAFLNGGEFKNRFMGQLNIVGKTDSLTNHPSSVTPSIYPSPVSPPPFHPPSFCLLFPPFGLL